MTDFNQIGELFQSLIDDFEKDVVEVATINSALAIVELMVRDIHRIADALEKIEDHQRIIVAQI